ncbi:MAG: sodium:solute symporter family protein [Firmicutes bacterium]|nr:sodium:solute symporter family protein [Bacillota bacterium]
MTVYAIGVAAMFIIYLVIGNVSGRAVKNVDDYYVAGRNAPTILVVGSLIASYLSTVAFMGEVGFSYSGYLLPFMFMYGTCATGYFVGSKFFGRFIRRAKAMTIPDYFGTRFRSTRVRVLAGIVTCIGLFCYLVSVTQGTALLLTNVLGVSYLVSLIIVWVVFTSFCIFAGSKGILLTETLMFLVFTVMALISVPYIMKVSGGWPDAIINSVLLTEKPGLFDWCGVMSGEFNTMGTPLDIVVWIVTFSLIWIVVLSISPWQASRYLMAKDEHTIFRAGLAAPMCAILVCTLIHFSVTTINATDMYIDPVENAFISTALHYFPVWLGIVVCGGILSAGLSSCATFTTLIGFSLANDIIAPIVKRNKGAEYTMSLSTSRICMAIVGLLALIVTYCQPPAVMWIAYFAATLFAVSWAVIGFGSIWSKKMTEQSAFWSMLTGIGVFVIFQLLITFAGLTMPAWLPEEFIAFLCSWAVFFIVNAVTKPTAEDEAYLKMLHTPLPNTYDKKEIKRTLLYPKIMIAFGVLVVVGLIFFYYMPYTEAIAMLH